MEEIIPIVIVVVGLLVKFLSGRKKAEDDAPTDFGGHSVPRRVLKRDFESMESGGQSVRPATVVPVARPNDDAARARDQAILEEQRRLAELAAQVTAQNAGAARHFDHDAPDLTEAQAYAIPDENPGESYWSQVLPEFIREHPQASIALAEILAPPKALARR